ncbi:unnamed protein product, partial [Heligmosomoides polygyrus]
MYYLSRNFHLIISEEVPGSPARLSPIEVTVDTEVNCQIFPLLCKRLRIGPRTDVIHQEAMTLRRVEELRRSGLWSAQRLPLCVEPPRNKTHWDYVLEEMKWMATDFRMERQFKRNVARKVAKFIFRLRSPYKTKMIRDFWQSVDKVVEHRAQEILEAKKRKALDAHMAFIVGEADKLSSIVQEGLTQDRASKTPSVTSDGNDDADFCGSESESDDEMTIEREEAAMQEQGRDDVQEEVSALNKEADQDIDDLLASVRCLEAVRTRDAEEIEEGSKAKRPKIEEASDEDSGSGRKSDDRPSSSVEAGKVEEDDMSVDEGPNRTDGRGMLESVDYAKLNSVSSDERQKELANIAEAALKFQPKGYTLETTQVKTTVPFLIRGTLREYQMVGLDWLVTLYEKNLNGILADEMGLGKTIQTIALLAHLACCESIWGPHLIIVPTSVILNWEMELKKWCPAFKILTYFGSQKDRAEKRKGWMKPNTFHVCITSYKTVTTDIRAFKKRVRCRRWFCSDVAMASSFECANVFLLKEHSTPLQNSLMELWSLMHFLMPAIFASHDDFKDWFSNPLTGMMEGSVEFNAPLVQQLHKVLRPFILRRLKSEVEKQLPKKTEHVIKCSLSKRQRYLYDDFMSRRSTRDNLKSGNVLSVLNIVMQLRKCCNHPNLFEPRSVESPMCVHQLRLSIPGLVLDLNEKEFGRDIPEIFDLRKRFTGVSSATVSLEPCSLSSSLPSLRGGFHYNMQNGGVHESETNERRVMRPPKEQRKGQFADLVPVILRRKEEDKKVRLRRIVERFECQQRPFYSHQLISLLKTSVADKVILPLIEIVGFRFWIWVNPAVTQAPSIEPTSSGRGYLARALEQQFSSTSRELLSTLHPLTHKALVASQLHFPELRLIEYDCGKLQALSRLLRRLYALKHRCLIFTQMSKMLDVLQAFLSYHGYQYFRLDGTTGIEQRQAMMERFNADPKIFCFILSTRSGGVGVNLTGADTVIFYDSDWNPTMDAQAQDRCHRIGQTRNVTIFRLISEKTIEENILRKANQKRRLGEMAIDDAMAVLEDEQDVTAAKMLIAETNADKAEFDETCLDKDEPMDEKYIELISQLKPIERYAVNFLEAEYKPEFDEEVREAEAMIGQKREEWVKAHNKALSNGDADAEHDENSSRLDDEFYGAGMLLDEVRSRRKSRVTAS